jgi:hypothetical protein
MKYECGTEVMLGDEIMVGHGPHKEVLARVVTIGTDQAIDGIDQKFYSWAKRERIIDKDTVVVEWISANPLAHDDPHHAPVGNYMTIHSLCCETFVRRGQPK